MRAFRETCLGSGRVEGFQGLGFTQRPLSSSFLGLPYRILNINHNKQLLRGLWVGFRVQASMGAEHTGAGFADCFGVESRV